MAQYFGKKHETAIIKFIDPNTNEREKTELYDTFIYPAFKKLADELIKRYNLKGDDPNNDFRNECITDMTLKINKFDPVRGSAFSFFNMACNNFIKSHIGKRKKHCQIKSESQENNIISDEYAVSQKDSGLFEQLIDNNYTDIAEENEFIIFFKNEVIKLITKSKNEREKKIFNNFIILLDSAQYMNIKTRRDSLSLIRTISMEEFEQREIAIHLKTLKEAYFKAKTKYYEL